MVWVTVPVAVSFFDTEPDRLLTTYTALPSGVTTTQYGSEPTVMVWVTVPVAVSIFDTEPELQLVTYAVFPSGVKATPYGLVPAVMVLVTVSLSPRREDRAVGTLTPLWPAAAAVIFAFIGTTPTFVNTAAAIMTITIPARRCPLSNTLMSAHSRLCAPPPCKNLWTHRAVSLSFLLLSTHTS